MGQAPLGQRANGDAAVGAFHQPAFQPQLEIGILLLGHQPTALPPFESLGA